MDFSINFVRAFHLGTTCLGMLLLLLIWLRGKCLQKVDKKNWGLLLISLSLFGWIAIDLMKILMDTVFSEITFQPKILSLLNNGFLLASLPYFPFGFQFLREKLPLFRNAHQWVTTILLGNSFLLILYLLFWEAGDLPSWGVLSSLEVAYSVFTLLIFGFGLLTTFFQRKFGYAFLSFAALILISLVISQMNYLPEFLSSIRVSGVFLSMVSHIGFIYLLLLFANSWTEMYEEKRYGELEKEKDRLLITLEENVLPAAYKPKGPGEYELVGAGTYLKFYKQNELLVLDLTILSKGIIGVKLYTKLRREYRDLLRFAVYKKAGVQIKAYGGSHKEFGGDIYKSILDIRKKLINPALEELGLPTLEKQELIIQKMKGSGIYELNCLPDQIHIDKKSLAEFIELEQLLQKLPI